MRQIAPGIVIFCDFADATPYRGRHYAFETKGQQRMAPAPSDSEILEIHYNYELDMLANTYRLLEDHRIQQNALIESFCLHARNLIEFLCDKNKGQQYPENYIPFAKNKTRIGKLNQLINHQISHLDVKQRTAKDSDKISDKNRSELITILSAETVEFRKHLKQSYRRMSISVLMQQQIPTARPASAANFPALASSGVSTTTTSAIGIFWSNDGNLVNSGDDREDREGVARSGR